MKQGDFFSDFPQQLNFSSPLRYCNEKVCAGYATSWALMTIGIVSIGLNVLHISVIRKLPTLKGKSHLSILIMISSTDIIYSAASLPMMCCDLREWINRRSSTPTLYLWLMSVTLESSVLCRFCAVFLSSLDRYFALCRPFFYLSSSLIRHVGKISIGLNVVLWLVLAVKGLLTLSDMCISGVIGPTRLNDVGGAATSTSVMLIFSATISFFLLNIWLEIKRIERRAPSTDDDHLKSSAYYIMAIFGLFVVILVIPSVIGTGTYIAYKAQDSSTPIPEAFLWSILGTHICYGIVNIGMYGLINVSYRKALVNHCLFSRLCRYELKRVDSTS